MGIQGMVGSRGAGPDQALAPRGGAVGSAGGLRQGATPSNYFRPVNPWVRAQLHL